MPGCGAAWDDEWKQDNHFWAWKWCQESQHLYQSKPDCFVQGWQQGNVMQFNEIKIICRWLLYMNGCCSLKCWYQHRTVGSSLIGIHFSMYWISKWDEHLDSWNEAQGKKRLGSHGWAVFCRRPKLQARRLLCEGCAGLHVLFRHLSLSKKYFYVTSKTDSLDHFVWRICSCHKSLPDSSSNKSSTTMNVLFSFWNNTELEKTTMRDTYLQMWIFCLLWPCWMDALVCHWILELSGRASVPLMSKESSLVVRWQILLSERAPCGKTLVIR